MKDIVLDILKIEESLQKSQSDLILRHKQFYRKRCGKYRKTLLHIAVKYSSDVLVLDYFISTLKICPQTATKKTKVLPIHISCKYGKTEATKFLYSANKSSIETKDALGNTPLSIACEFGCLEIVEFLISVHANVNTKNKENSSPLHLAALAGNEQIVKKLIQCGAKYFDLNFHNENCLHLAVQSQNINVVKIFVQLINNTSRSNKGSIIQYCRNNHSLLKFLLENTNWKIMPKLYELLLISAPLEIIAEYCKYELGPNSLYYISFFERDDLFSFMYMMKKASVKDFVEMEKMNLSQKCRMIVRSIIKWHKCAKILYWYKFCNDPCIKRLPESLVRECTSFL